MAFDDCTVNKQQWDEFLYNYQPHGPGLHWNFNYLLAYKGVGSGASGIRMEWHTLLF
jgi:hypothetical protein